MSDTFYDPEWVGRNLWISAKNLASNSNEFEAILKELQDALLEGSAEGLRFETRRGDKQGLRTWIRFSRMASFTVKKPRPGRGVKPSDLSLSLRLYDEREETESGWPWACVPKLFVAYSEGGPWVDENFSLSGAGTSEFTKPVPPYLWKWHEVETEWTSEKDWFFCLPLAAIKADDLRHQVIEPLAKLIGGASQEDAFPADSVACQAPNA